MPNTAGSVAIESVLRALADPTRRKLYERLVGAEASIARLTEQVSISQPAVSQHMAILRAAGLLSERRQGRSTIYRAHPKGLAPLVDWIARQDAFWREALDNLDTLLSEMTNDGCR
jgi:DNA-binding transcriptional ArsR family regulator